VAGPASQHPPYTAPSTPCGARRTIHCLGRTRNSLLAGGECTALSIIEIQGPDAAAYMETLFTNRMDFAEGKVVYSLLCTPKGGIKRDVAVARKSAHTYWVFTGNGTLPLEMAWLQHHRGDYSIHISEKSKTWAAIGLFGPHARDLLAQVTPNDVSNEAFPFYTWQNIEIGLATVYAMGLSYVGELGWEFHMMILAWYSAV